MKNTITKSLLISLTLTPFFQTIAFAIDKNRLDKLLVMSILSFLQYSGFFAFLYGSFTVILAFRQVEGADKKTGMKIMGISLVLMILKTFLTPIIEKL